MFSINRVTLTSLICLVSSLSTISMAFQLATKQETTDKADGALVIVSRKSQDFASPTFKGLPPIEVLSIEIPDCPPRRPPCNKGATSEPNSPTVKKLQEVTKLSSTHELFILLQPEGKELSLKALELQFRAGGKVLARYQLNLTGRVKPYSAIDTSGGAVRGYVFALEQRAAKEARKYFVSENTISLTAEVSGEPGGKAVFYLVNAKSKLL